MAIVARNLLARPRWIEPMNASGWKITPNLGGVPEDIPAVAYDKDPDPTHDGNGYRTYGTGRTYAGALFYPLGNIDPGDYYVWIRCRNGVTSTGEPSTFGIVPIVGGEPLWDASEYLPGEFEKFQKTLPVPYPAAMANSDVTVTIPDMSGYEYKDRYNESRYLPDHGEIEFAVVVGVPQKVNLMSIGGARLDAVSDYAEPIAGYIDGSLDDADGVEYGWQGEPFNSITLAETSAPDVIVIAPPVAQFSEDPPQFELPNTAGVDWLVNNEPYSPGAFQVDPSEEDVTVKIIPVAQFGYAFDPEPVEQEYTWQAATPDPDPDPDPDAGWEWPDEPTTGGKLVARWLKWDSEQQQRECSLYYEVVRSFVWGYTRGHGFDDDGLVPAKPLERVIVAAGARLAYNPEYVTRWQISQESETMSVFQGFNLAEQAILNRYRRTWA